MISDFVIKGDTLLDYTGTDTDIVIPDGIRRIGDAFREKNITSVTMPDSVSIICNVAFEGCAKLRQVKFSEKLRGIGCGAFRGCSDLTEITFPERLSVINAMAFSDCTGLTAVTIPKPAGVIHGVIRDGAFCGCSSLRSIALPNNFFFGADLFFTRMGPLLTLQLWDPEERPAEKVLTVNYAGTKEAWTRISEPIDTSFISVVHCTDGDITL